MRKLLCYISLLVAIGWIGATTIIGDDHILIQGSQRSPIDEDSILQALTVSEAVNPSEESRDRDPLDQGSDNCPATAIPNLPYSDTGTTAGRTNDWNTAGSCAGGGGTSNAPDVIYSYTPAVGGAVVISTCGSAFNTLLEIRTGGTCPGTTQVACADAGCGGDAEVRITLTGSMTYYIIVDGYNTQSGNYTLTVASMCNVYSHAGDIAECPESADSSHARLDCDGGPCNILYGGTASYNPIYCGQIYYGHGFTYTRGTAPFSDTDWYRFSVSEACTVRITANAEFPSLISAGAILANCALHTSTVYGYTCIPYSLTVPNVPPGDYEFTFSPWDPSGIPALRDYRVQLECIPMSGCTIDGTVTAPGSFSGNTCGAERDCNLTDPGSEEQMLRIIIPDDDDWVFDLTSEWYSSLRLMHDCCNNAFEHWHPDITHVFLTAGEYFLDVGGTDDENCGAYTLDVFRFRGRCCYVEPDYQNCVDTSLTICEALGGIFNSTTNCAEEPCRYIPPCPDDALFSQRPFGQVNRYGYGFSSDKFGLYQRADNFSMTSGPIGSLRFWGMIDEYMTGPDCPLQAEPFRIRIYTDSLDSPGSLAREYNVSAAGTPIDEPYETDEDTLYEYNIALSPPLELTNGWISIVGSDSDNCVFFWASSPFGDDNFATFQNDTLHPGLTGIDMAFCLGGCLVDGEITAPGSFSGNTCGAGRDCLPPGPEDHMIRVIIPDADDWSFEIEGENYNPYMTLYEECCSGWVSAWFSMPCLNLAPGDYFIWIRDVHPDSGDCGSYTVSVTRCRERCCYGDEYQLCADTTRTFCESVGGILDYDRPCAENPCPYIPPCPDGSLYVQPPLGSDVNHYGRTSDLNSSIQCFDNFEGITSPANLLRFFGMTRNVLTPCVENPMPFRIVFREGYYPPGDIVATYEDTLVGTMAEVYAPGDTLFEYNLVLSPPLDLEHGWIGVMGAGDPSCDFYWKSSGIGDNIICEQYGEEDSTIGGVGGSDLAFCLAAGCPPVDSLVLQHTTGNMFVLAFWAPIDANYKFYYTTSTTAEFPTGFTLASQLALNAGHQQFNLNLTTPYQRWLVVTNCE